MLRINAGIRIRKTVTAVGIAGVLALLAACGSGDAGGSSDGGQKDPTAAAAAAENLDRAFEPTSSINITEPLNGTPQPGTLVYNIHFNISSATPFDAPFEEAAAALGWTLRTLTTDPTDPLSGSNAIKQAVQAGADYIAVNSSSVDALKAGLDAAMDADVPVILTGGVGTPEGAENGVYANVMNADGIIAMYETLMDWVIADSEGAGDVLIVTSSDYPILVTSTKGQVAYLDEHCPMCNSDVLALSGSVVASGQTADPIVAELRKNPDIKYITTDLSPVVNGLRQALDAAGLNDVKVSLGDANGEQYPLIRSGVISVGLAYGVGDTAFAAIDVMARLQLNMPFDQELYAKRPVQAWTKDNLGADVNDSWFGPVDYQKQFLTLWGKA